MHTRHTELEVITHLVVFLNSTLAITDISLGVIIQYRPKAHSLYPSS